VLIRRDDDQATAFESHRRYPLDDGADRNAPREVNFAARNGDVSQQLGDRAGQRVGERSHDVWILSPAFIMAPVRLVLASASPRRAELLRAAGFVFDTLAVDVDERVRPGESAGAYVRRLAMEKSARAMHLVTALRTRAGEAIPEDAGDRVVVLGADTGVVIDGEILGKPRDDADAGWMLRRLSGRRHEVMTGVSLRCGAVELGTVVTTAVDCNALTDADVSWYVASGEGRDKAGAYAIQGLASRFMPRIEGSYSNVVGLPIACVFELFERLR